MTRAKMPMPARVAAARAGEGTRARVDRDVQRVRLAAGSVAIRRAWPRIADARTRDRPAREARVAHDRPAQPRDTAASKRISKPTRAGPALDRARRDRTLPLPADERDTARIPPLQTRAGSRCAAAKRALHTRAR